MSGYSCFLFLNGFMFFQSLAIAISTAVAFRTNMVTVVGYFGFATTAVGGALAAGDMCVDRVQGSTGFELAIGSCQV